MKGVFLKKRILFFLFSQTMYGQVVVIASDQEHVTMYDGHHCCYETQFDVVTQEHMHPFAFTASPLGHVLRLIARLSADLAQIESNNNMELFCDSVLDLSTLCDVAFLYIKRQISLIPEKQNYFLQEMHYVQQRIGRLSEQFSRCIDQKELSPESITICVVFDRMMKKTEQMFDL